MAPVWKEPMQMQLSSAALLIADVVNVFSPQAGAIFDLAIVVTAVMVVIFLSSLASRGKTAGLPDSFLLATATQQLLDISFLTAAHQKKQ